MLQGPYWAPKIKEKTEAKWEADRRFTITRSSSDINFDESKLQYDSDGSNDSDDDNNASGSCNYRTYIISGHEANQYFTTIFLY